MKTVTAANAAGLHADGARADLPRRSEPWSRGRAAAAHARRSPRFRRRSACAACACGTARSRWCAASTSRFARARSSPSSGPTAPARRPPWRSSRATASAAAARSASWAPIRRGRTQAGGPASASCCRSRSRSPSSPSASACRSTPATTRRRGRLPRRSSWSASTGCAKTRCGTLSGGQRRRLDVALALIGDPELIFLDEPTTGFDPSARRSAWELIAGLRSLGKTIFLTTHYMEEAEELADRIAVIAAGQIVAEGTPDTLGGPRPAKRRWCASACRRASPADELPAEVRAATVAAADGSLEARAPEPPAAARRTGRVGGRSRPVELPDLTVSRPTLEDVYLQLTRRSDERPGPDDRAPAAPGACAQPGAAPVPLRAAQLRAQPPGRLLHASLCR